MLFPLCSHGHAGTCLCPLAPVIGNLSRQLCVSSLVVKTHTWSTLWMFLCFEFFAACVFLSLLSQSGVGGFACFLPTWLLQVELIYKFFQCWEQIPPVTQVSAEEEWLCVFIRMQVCVCVCADVSMCVHVHVWECAYVCLCIHLRVLLISFFVTLHLLSSSFRYKLVNAPDWSRLCLTTSMQQQVPWQPPPYLIEGGIWF